MTKKEVARLLVFINTVYPNFTVNQEKIDAWSRLLADQNPAIIMRNAERHSMSSKFPPVIADLREVKKEAHGNDFLEKVEQWEREALGYKP